MRYICRGKCVSSLYRTPLCQMLVVGYILEGSSSPLEISDWRLNFSMSTFTTRFLLTLNAAAVRSETVLRKLTDANLTFLFQNTHVMHKHFPSLTFKRSYFLFITRRNCSVCSIVLNDWKNYTEKTIRPLTLVLSKLSINCLLSCGTVVW